MYNNISTLTLGLRPSPAPAYRVPPKQESSRRCNGLNCKRMFVPQSRFHRRCGVCHHREKSVRNENYIYLS